MSSIDTRIVELKLNNAQFMRGISETKKALDDLNKNLKFDGAAKGAGEINKAVRGISFSPLQRGIDFVRTGFDRMSTHVTGIFGRLNRDAKFDGAVRGIGEVNRAAQGVNLGPLQSGVDSINSKFTALGVVAATVISNITNKAMSMGQTLVKSFTIDPVKDGLAEYETKLNSVQTILANTSAAGTTLKDVNATLSELNTYADQTIYNFGEMARNIGTFTAAGVDLQTATGSIKGIANLAALSGSNSQQASTAMYQLSQAISAGRVSLQDWNSVVNAGMGGTVFQRALAQTAEKMGTLDKGAVELSGKMKNVTVNGQSFRESITAKPGEESWLTSEVLTETLNQFTGDLTDAELAAQGFSEAQIKAIQKQAAMAKSAATEVKTFSHLMDTLKESAGSGWADTWQIIIGDFEQAKKLWTGVNKVIGGAIDRQTKARNQMLGQWARLGGRTAMFDGLKNVFDALLSVLKPITQAFRDIFPATTGRQLAEMSRNFQDFTEKLKMGAQTSTNLKRTFRGVFAVFGIGWEVIKQVARVFAELFGVVSSGGGGFLAFTAKIGDFFTQLHRSIKNGEALKLFFTGLSKILQIPIKAVQALGRVFGAFFDGLTSNNISGSVDGFRPLADIGEKVKAAWEGVTDLFDRIGKSLDKGSGGISKFFGNIGKSLSEGFSNISFEDILGGITVAGITTFLLSLKKAFDSFGGAADSVGEAIGNITSPFEELTNTLQAMQNTLRAFTILQIAAAVGILAWSVGKLAEIDEKALKKALIALSILFVQLGVSMAAFQKINISSGFAQLILMAVAIRVLTSALTQLSNLSWEELAKGLTGTAALLGLLVAATHLMPDGKKLIRTSLGIVVLAGAIKVLVSAAREMSSLSWEEMTRGLIGVGALLAGLVLFTKFQQANKGGLIQSVGLLILAGAIKVLASALNDFGDMSWGEIGRGLAAMAGGLILIGVALALLPPTSLFSAAAIFVVAASLGMIGDAMQQMGGMSWTEIAKSLVVLAVSLTIITIAVNAMTTAIVGAAALVVVALALGMLVPVLESFGNMDVGEIVKSLIMLAGALTIIAIATNAMTTAIVGAAALLVVAAALAVLTPVLIALGSMSWGEILKSLFMLAAAITVLGVTSAVLGFVSPLIMAFAVAVAVLGVGILSLGVGLLATATAFRIFASAGQAGITAMLTLVQGLISMIPQLATALAQGVVAFAKVIGVSGPAIAKAMTAVMSAFLDSIRKVAPKAIQTFTTIMLELLAAVRRLSPQIINTMMKLMNDLLNAIQRNMPKFVEKGANIIVSFLNGISANMGDIIAAATRVIVAFINGISANLGLIINAGVRLIISFVNGVANAIRDHQDEMNAAGRNLASAIVEGMVSGIKNGIGWVTDTARNLASNALKAAKDALGINSPSKEFIKLGKYSAQGYAIGLKGNKKEVTKAIEDMYQQMAAVKKSSLADIDALERRLKRLKRARRKDARAIAKTNKYLAQARRENKRVEQANRVRRSRPYQKNEDRLLRLAKRKDKLDANIDEAKQKLADAKKVRDDYKKQIYDQYRDLPDFDKETKLADYVKDFQKQIIDTQIYTSQLAELRKRGLNDQMYQELVAKGPEAIPFVTQILEGGKTSVKELNTLGSALAKSASKLASNASTALYQAGVDAAQGLVNGLEKQRAAIQKQMNRIAAGMVKSIKKALGIRSPSREFMKVGNWSVEGLAKGLSDIRPAVQATEASGTAIMESMRKSISGVSDILDGAMDGDPTIRPVLDLSQVKKDAGEIDGILRAGPINPSGSYNSAAQAAYYKKLAAEQTKLPVETPSERVTENINYIQNNYSPKALSAADIYRQTKNQISTAKKGSSE